MNNNITHVNVQFKRYFGCLIKGSVVHVQPGKCGGLQLYILARFIQVLLLLISSSSASRLLRSYSEVVRGDSCAAIRAPAGQGGILRWTQLVLAGSNLYDLWFHPVTREEAKPRHCRLFPISREHAKEAACPGHDQS